MAVNADLHDNVVRVCEDLALAAVPVEDDELPKQLDDLVDDALDDDNPTLSRARDTLRVHMCVHCGHVCESTSALRRHLKQNRAHAAGRQLYLQLKNALSTAATDAAKRLLLFRLAQFIRVWP